MSQTGRPLIMIAVVGAIVIGLSVAPTVGAHAADPDARRGEKLFDQQCTVCHAVQPEFHKEGPSLYGIYGRRAGTAPFFGGYKGLKGATFTWNDKTLDQWLIDPRTFLSGKDTGMTIKVSSEQERQDLIAYLKTLH